MAGVGLKGVEQFLTSSRHSPLYKTSNQAAAIPRLPTLGP